ncbi:hypothetical protein [Salmonella phage NINP13076]|nr:hypothetical protein [Salmonella phage NINP13076]
MKPFEKRRIALDFDDTFTLDPERWAERCLLINSKENHCLCILPIINHAESNIMPCFTFCEIEHINFTMRFFLLGKQPVK